MSKAPSSQAISGTVLSSEATAKLSKHVLWAKALLQNAKTEILKDIVDQDDAIEKILTTVVADGHVLAESVPGLGKTKTMKSVGKAIGLTTSRIQFTPDLQPIDLTGSEVKNKHTGEWEFIPGPLYGEFVLADEINRAGQKTQAATLEVMEERQITVNGETRKQPRPFNLMGTQNPVDQDGTSPLPEAQSDRFMMKITFDYVSADAEKKIALTESSTDADIDEMFEHRRLFEEDPTNEAHDLTKQKDADRKINAQQAFTKYDLLIMQKIAMKLPVDQAVLDAVVELVRMLRPTKDNTDKYIQDNVALGPSPRAEIAFMRAAKAQVLMKGYTNADGTPQMSPTKADLAELVAPILGHRIMMAPTSSKKPEDVLKYVVEKLKL